jgi:hypothetical protein
LKKDSLNTMNKPSITSKIKQLTKEAIVWSKNDFGLVTEEQYEDRVKHCKACEHWDPSGFANTGACNVCGCSTVVKLKLTTTECPLPVPKWEAIVTP